MSRLLICLTLTLLAGFAGCGKRVPSDARIFHVEGFIREFPSDGRTVLVEHEDVPGFMPSMTMPFYIKDKTLPQRFKPGDAVAFRFIVTPNDSWIDEVQKIDPKEISLPAAAAEPPGAAVITAHRLKEGDLMPEFSLTSQENQPLHLADFHGKPLVMTFVFTRCPVPNFCPLMSKNFKALQNAIEAAQPPVSEAHLLSVSIDPEFDTPAILKQYAGFYEAHPDRWTFATGAPEDVQKLTSQFSVYVKPEGGTISHGLATVLVDRNGAVRKIWRGNAWDIQEVLQALKEI